MTLRIHRSRLTRRWLRGRRAFRVHVQPVGGILRDVRVEVRNRRERLVAKGRRELITVNAPVRVRLVRKIRRRTRLTIHVVARDELGRRVVGVKRVRVR